MPSALSNTRHEVRGAPADPRSPHGTYPVLCTQVYMYVQVPGSCYPWCYLPHSLQHFVSPTPKHDAKL